MLDTETKKKIDSARDILVGKIPDPTAQVDQITTALIYKFMDDMDQMSKSEGGTAKFFTGDFKKYSWPKIIDKKLSGQERLVLYMQAIEQLAKNEKLPSVFREIFKNAFLPYRDAETLNLFLKEINGFTYDHSENLGNAFEYLLSILGSQGDAGQFRTPRHIIDFIVEVIDPKKEESILDPACGTSGFLISSYKHILKNNSKNYKTETDNYSFARNESSADIIQIQSNGKYKGENLKPADKKRLERNIVGYDISPEMVKLSLVNMYLHHLKKPQIYEYDSLTNTDHWDNDFNVILANPPFMSPKGGIRPHNKFSVKANRAEVLFVDYIAEHLTINGRAGIIVPEGIIFKSDKAYKALRKMLVEDQFLWAVASLPAGIFLPYSGVKTSILFLDKKRAKNSNEILFINIQNDGFDLGATRRKIDKNDLSQAFKILKSWSKGKKETTDIAHWVSKEKIIKSEDYNLTGNRYKINIRFQLKDFNQNCKKVISNTDKVKMKQRNKVPIKILTDAYKELTTQINHITIASEFLNTTEAIQNNVKQIQKSLLPITEVLKSNYVMEDTVRQIYSPIMQDLKRLQEAQQLLEENLQYQKKWPMVELGKICKLVNGYAFKSQHFSKKGIPVIRISNIKNGIVDFSNSVKIKKSSEFEKYSINKGDLLIAMSGATTGKVGLYLEEQQAYQNQRVGKFKIVSDTIDPKYRNYIIISLQEKILNISYGGAQPNISPNKIEQIKIPLPPLKVQKEIVAEIDRYQKIISSAKQIVETWKPTFKIDPAWSMVELGDICKIVRGGSPRPIQNYITQDENGINWIKIGDVAENEKYITQTKQKIKKKGASKTRLVKIEDFILSNSMSFGRPYILKIDGAIHDGWLLIRINDKKKVFSDFLYEILKSNSIQNQYQRLATGGVVKNLNSNLVKSVQIPLPSLSVQKEIVEQIEKEKSHVESCKELIKINKKKIQQKINEVWGEDL